MESATDIKNSTPIRKKSDSAVDSKNNIASNQSIKSNVVIMSEDSTPFMHRVSVPISETDEQRLSAANIFFSKSSSSLEEKQLSINNNIENNHETTQSGRSKIRSSFLDYKESVVDHNHNINETITQRNTRIRNQRGAFKWLPVFFANDLLHGSYWFLWGSIFAMIIPIIPLVAIYEDLWHTTEAFYPKKYTAVYTLLVVIGIFYSIGSYFFLRVFEEPAVGPLINCCPSLLMFSTDEVIGAWMFLLGTSPSIPIVALYVYEEPHSYTFGVALAVSCIATFSMAVFTYMVIPSSGEVHPTKPTHRLDFLRCCWCNLKFLNRHLENDWLIAAWLFFIFSLFSVIISIGKLADSVVLFEERGIYDWTTGLINCIMFTIGSAYFVAGSYPIHDTKEVQKVELTTV